MAAAFHTHLFTLVGGAFEVGRDGAMHEAWVCGEMSPNWARWLAWTFTQQCHGARLAEGSFGMRWASGLRRLEQVSLPRD